MGFEEPLPADADVHRERTLTGKIALAVLVVMIIFVTTSFVTTNWLEGDPKFYGTKFEKLGLWVHCFRSLPDYNDLDHRRFYAGCRWIFNPFTEGYAEIRTYIVPRKFSKFGKIICVQYPDLFYSNGIDLIIFNLIL